MQLYSAACSWQSTCVIWANGPSFPAVCPSLRVLLNDLVASCNIYGKYNLQCPDLDQPMFACAQSAEQRMMLALSMELSNVACPGALLVFSGLVVSSDFHLKLDV